MTVESLRGQVAIVGAADTEVGKVPELGATQLCIDAAKRVLDDAGISKDQVDGLVTCNSMVEPYMYHSEAIAEYLQIFPRYCISIGAGGGTTYGPTVPAFYALIARAHMDTYGTTPEQLAAVAVACRKHAALNPAAQMRDLISVDDVVNSRMIDSALWPSCT